MAGKPRNRLELRRQNEAAEPIDPMEDEPEEGAEEGDDEEATERKPKKKPKAAAKPKAKPKAKSAKAPKPATRMRIVWVVTNDAFKPVGTFEYSQKEAAEARAAELTAKGKGTHFVQKVKEPMPENAPGLGAAIPRAAAAAAPAATSSRTKAAAAPVEDDEEMEDEEEEVEVEEEPEEDEE
jgi:hypothetical protein